MEYMNFVKRILDEMFILDLNNKKNGYQRYQAYRAGYRVIIEIDKIRDEHYLVTGFFEYFSEFRPPKREKIREVWYLSKKGEWNGNSFSYVGDEWVRGM